MKSKGERNVETAIREYAAERGATVHEHAAGHFQIKGKLLVNYWPYSKKRTVHIDGTNQGKRNVTPKEAVDMAFEVPAVVPAERRDERSKNSRRKRWQLIRRDGPKCYWCPMILTIDTSTIDHVIPLYRGGMDNANNRVLACQPCNTRRGSDMPELRCESVADTPADSGERPPVPDAQSDHGSDAWIPQSNQLREPQEA